LGWEPILHHVRNAKNPTAGVGVLSRAKMEGEFVRRNSAHPGAYISDKVRAFSLTNPVPRVWKNCYLGVSLLETENRCGGPS